MKKREVLALEVFKAISPKKSSVTLSVSLVYRGSFNDERMIASKTFSLNELCDKPILYFDLYLGKNKGGTKEIAIAAIEGFDIYLIERTKGRRRVIQVNALSAPFTDDYDDKYIISAQII